MVAIKFKIDYEDKKKGEVIMASGFLASYLLVHGIAERSSVKPTDAEIAERRKANLLELEKQKEEMQLIQEIEAEEKKAKKKK